MEQVRRQQEGGRQGSDTRYEGGSDDENETPAAANPAGDARAGQDGGAVNIEEVELEDEDDQAPQEGSRDVGGGFSPAEPAGAPGRP